MSNEVIYNKRVRVFHMQTCETNIIHETVYQATLLFSRICKARKTIKSTGRSDRAIFIALDALQSRELHCS